MENIVVIYVVAMVRVLLLVNMGKIGVIAMV